MCLFRLAIWFCQIECTACQLTCCPCKTRRGVLLKTIHSWGGCMDDVIYTSAALVWMRFAISFCNELNVNFSGGLDGAPVVLVPIYGFYNRDMAQLSITLDRCNQVQGLYGLWLKISSICWLYSFLHRCLLKKCEPLILAVASYLISVLSIKIGLN